MNVFIFIKDKYAAKNGAAILVPPQPFCKVPLKYNIKPVSGSELNAISGTFLILLILIAF